MDVIGEATNEMNSKTVTAIAYGTAKAKYVLPQNVPYGFKTPEMVPILVSATNLRRGPIEAADELPGIVTYYNGEIKILDEDELIDAYNQGDVLPEDYEMAYKLRDKLLEEIKNGTNKLLNIDYNKYLKDF